MTHDEFRIKVNEIIPELNNFITKNMEKIIKSGCIDFDQYENDYILPKIFISAMGKQISYSYKPFINQQNDLKNMEYFLNIFY